MYSYRNDPYYPSVDLSQEVIDAALARGRKMRAEAFRDLAVRFYDWVTTPRRPVGDTASLRHGTVVRPSTVS